MFGRIKMYKFIKLLKLLICFFSIVSSNFIWAESKDSAELKDLLEPVISLRATFQQTVRNEQGRLLQNLSGKVVLKKPAQFRWEVLGKEPRLIVADGKKVWDFDQELEQVTVQKLSKGQMRAPIFFLTGDTNALDKDFIVTQLVSNKGRCLENSEVCFQLKPKREESSFQWIKIGFKDRIIKEMQLLDQLGQYSHLIFKNIKLNENISEMQFQFMPPAGVDVLEND